MHLRDCPICLGSEPRMLQFSTGTEWPLVACASCGFVYLGRVPGYRSQVEDYGWERIARGGNKRPKPPAKSLLGRISAATNWRMGIARMRERRRRSPLSGTTGNVLDIGCCNGCGIPPGPTPFGIEISAVLAAHGRPLFEARGGTVICAPAVEGLDAFEDGFFSAVLLRSYLEHEERPRAVLEKVFARLKAGGIAFVRVPDYGSINRRLFGRSWCGFRFPDHVNYFSDATLRDLARRVGLRYRRTNWYSILDDNLIVELTKPH